MTTMDSESYIYNCMYTRLKQVHHKIFKIYVKKKCFKW